MEDDDRWVDRSVSRLVVSGDHDHHFHFSITTILTLRYWLTQLLGSWYLLPLAQIDDALRRSASSRSPGQRFWYLGAISPSSLSDDDEIA
jgi:hypothetical protein